MMGSSCHVTMGIALFWVPGEQGGPPTQATWFLPAFQSRGLWVRDSGIQVEQKLFQWGFIPTFLSSPTAPIESLTRMDSSPLLGCYSHLRSLPVQPHGPLGPHVLLVTTVHDAVPRLLAPLCPVRIDPGLAKKACMALVQS